MPLCVGEGVEEEVAVRDVWLVPEGVNVAMEPAPSMELSPPLPKRFWSLAFVFVPFIGGNGVYEPPGALLHPISLRRTAMLRFVTYPLQTYCGPCTLLHSPIRLGFQSRNCVVVTLSVIVETCTANSSLVKLKHQPKSSPQSNRTQLTMSCSH